jgi:hypothetical protein
MLNSIRFFALCFSALALVGSGDVTAQDDGVTSRPVPLSPQEIEDYWTPERINDAQPLPTPPEIIPDTEPNTQPDSEREPISQDPERGVPATSSEPSPAIASGEVEICHVPPKPKQTEPFASGRIITIPREDCYDHCNDHGGDHAMFDGACAAAPFDEKTCIVNSPEPECSSDRCLAVCATDCGDCFVNRDSESAGCDVSACEAKVCAIDSFCCENSWDELCVIEAIQICAIDNNYCED